jgi:hypothetical protein
VRSHRLVFPALAALLASCADPFGTLSSPLREPDLKATIVFFERVSGNGDWIDTVAAGEDVFVMVQTVCAGEFLFYRLVIMANADTVEDGQGGCTGDGTGWGAGGRSWTPPRGGVYHFTAVLDADDQFAETNESNNTATGMLIVLGRSIP